MIEELRNDVSRLLKITNRITNHRFTDPFVLYLIYLKHLCDTNKYKYEEVINDNNLYDLFSFVETFKKTNKEEFPINKLLRNISIYDSKELVKEFLANFETLMAIYDSKKERIFIINRYAASTDFIGYDQDGLTTYIPKREHEYEYFKAIDEILGIKNKYLKEADIKLDKYNYLCVYDTKPKYRFIKDNNEYDLIYDYLHKIDNVILYTTYSKISNFKDGRRILRYLKTVILYEDRAIMIFNKDATATSIINYDPEKIKSIDKLKSIIENNRKQKDVLVKTSFEEIISNNSRIGFSLYELDKSEEIKDINKIVDQNTRLLEGLNRINETVEQEINKLLNR